MNNKKIDDVERFLADRHEAYCEIRCFDLDTRPKAANDVHNRIILHERIRRLNLPGHEESVVFAMLGGESISDVAREYRTTKKRVRQILASVERKVTKQIHGESNGADV